VVLDMMATAREDGTHALRSVQQTTELLTAAGITITARTVKRHRAWAVTHGYAHIQERGGRSSAATIYTATLPKATQAASVSMSGEQGTAPSVNLSRADQGTPARLNLSRGPAESRGQAGDKQGTTPRLRLSRPVYP
jgi:hypothetical protein